MRRVWLVTVVSLAALAIMFASAAKAESAMVPAKDDAEIRAALQGMTDAWNAHDMKAFVSYMTDDVEWVNVVGMWWKGKAQVFKAHDTLHRTMFKNRQLQNSTTVELRALTPDVVVATSIVPADGFTTAQGQVFPPGRDALTEVFVHRGGRWLVAEGHNTPIDEGAGRHDPGK